MGMDVYGKAPTDEVGNYFRNNVWYWAGLANYCIATAPNITQMCRHWYTNDGDGLDASRSVRLANALQVEVDSGRTAAFAAEWEAKRLAIPKVTCELCNGTGTRPDGLSRFGAEWVKNTKGCNGCRGTGQHDDISSWCHFTVENVQEFINFLRHCGGFEIC
jgi:hypothetical protein